MLMTLQLLMEIIFLWNYFFGMNAGCVSVLAYVAIKARLIAVGCIFIAHLLQSQPQPFTSS